MIRYLLDNAPLAVLLLGRSGADTLIRPWMQRREVATSIIAYGEVVEYLRGFADFSHHHRALQWLLWVVQPYELTFEIMDRYADIWRAIRPPHGPGLIGDMDTLIAATALEHSLTVVTSDAHYQRVPGLSVMRIDPAHLRR